VNRPASLQDRDFEIFSGHESFVCRYGWLPKLYEAVVADADIFGDDDGAIVTLGIGKNMVKSIRFWGQAFGLTETAATKKGGTIPTDFARKLLDPDSGRDPYLEDTSSLWRLHWMLTTRSHLGAWAAAFMDLHETEVTKDLFVDLTRRRAVTARGAVTPATIGQHVDIFLRTYDAGRLRSDSVFEETLGCPLQELALLDVREVSGQTVLRFRRGAKPDLDAKVLAFAVADFWKSAGPGSRTISLRSLMLDRRSPGTVFRLDEASMHSLLDNLCSRLQGFAMRDDGVGGVDLVCNDGRPAHERLERFAWQ
jgi:hypothetical protein